MSELYEWLEIEAKLTGKKLVAKEQCLEGMVEDLADLQQLYEEGRLQDVLPQTMLRSMVEKALANGTFTTSSAEQQPTNLAVNTTNLQKRKNNQTSQRADPQLTTQASTRPNALSMPAHKLFGCFASHKKTHSVFGDACEVTS